MSGSPTQQRRAAIVRGRSSNRRPPYAPGGNVSQSLPSNAVPSAVSRSPSAGRRRSAGSSRSMDNPPDTKRPFMGQATPSPVLAAQAAPPPNADSDAALEEEEAEDDVGYSVDHLSAVVRPVALTMILAR